MRFLKAQFRGMLVGLGVLIVWATLDWFSAKCGVPTGLARSYSDTFFAATAGAAIVFCGQSS